MFVDGRCDFADLASSFADIKPILKFSTPEVEGDVCGWSLRIKLTVGVKNSVGDVTKSLSLKVGFSTSDMGDALVDGIMTAFDAVKDAFKGLHTAVTSSSKRRRRRRRRRLYRYCPTAIVGTMPNSNCR